MAKDRVQSRPDVCWSRRREIPDPQIVDAADQYEEACRLLLKQPPGSGVLLPLVNTAAISIELYLKSLSAERIYTADTDMPEISTVSAYAERTGHCLKTLFDAISEDIRIELTAAFDDELRPELNQDFVTALEKIEGAFVVSRYPFEPTAAIADYSADHLAGIAKFLRSFVKSLPVESLIEWREKT